MPAMKGITVRIDAELHAEIKAYLEENGMTMGEFIALAAQDELYPRSPGLDPELQAEVQAHLEGSEMTTSEFIAQAVQNELHPKTPELEVNSMEKEPMRTLAFQVPESLFQRVKQYLERNHMTQKQFVLGLIEDELDKDEELLRKEQEEAQEAEEEEQVEGFSEDVGAPMSEDGPEVEYGDEQEETPAVGDSEGGFDDPDEDESEQVFSEDEQEYAEDSEQDFIEAESDAYLEEEEQDEGLSGDVEAPVDEDGPEVEYDDEQEEAPAVGDSESGFDEPDEDDIEQEVSEDEQTAAEFSGPEYVEGELGAAVEVAHNIDPGEDEQPVFPESDEEEEQEYGGMEMSM